MEPINWRQAFEAIKAKLANPVGRNHFEEITLPYLPSIVWSDETLVEDWEKFWPIARRAYNRLREDQYLKRWEWAADKKLKPKQVFKLLNK